MIMGTGELSSVFSARKCMLRIKSECVCVRVSQGFSTPALLILGLSTFSFFVVGGLLAPSH